MFLRFKILGEYAAMNSLKALSLVILAALALSACGQKPAEQAVNANADVTTLLASADLKQGERSYLQCRACHSLNEGGINKVGPNLYGVFGSPAGQMEGFNYSEALLASGVVWDVQNMDEWLARPAELIPQNRMVFVGIRDPQKRANLIAYLQQQTQ